MRPKRSDNPLFNGSQCPYCGGKTEYVDSCCIYGRSYGMVYLCRPCDAYCGVHAGTDVALGRLANKELRELKKQAHTFFDPIWKHGRMGRNQAYKWLAGILSIPKNECHIGMFDEILCRRAVGACKQLIGQTLNSF